MQVSDQSKLGGMIIFASMLIGLAIYLAPMAEFDHKLNVCVKALAALSPQFIQSASPHPGLKAQCMEIANGVKN